jgi:predicted RNase H-like nuclease
VSILEFLRAKRPRGKHDRNAPPPDATVGGLDGCLGGWVLATGPVGLGGPIAVEVVNTFKEVLARIQAGDLDAVAVDMPIGLPDRGPRRCDGEARARLGTRHSSVFPAPLRALLDAATWEEALASSRALTDRGISRQAFGILPKVREIDQVITPEMQDRVIEAHPEVSFAALAGGPMAHSKKKPAGRAERLAALVGPFSGITETTGERVPGATPDDVLDAYALLWTAARWVRGEAIVLGEGECDARGLRMEILA